MFCASLFSMVGGGIDAEERDVEDRDVRRIDRFFCFNSIKLMAHCSHF